LQKALKDNRISVNELISEIRAQGVGDISKVNYAILEQNGSLSVLSKNDSEMSHPLIIDGEINRATLTAMGYNDIWLNKRLDEARVNQKDIFLMTVDDNGKIFIVERDINEGQDNSNSKSHRCAGGSGAKRSSIKKQN
jgi:uncharacterized membrane protein YcaP (DUF421 family)